MSKAELAFVVFALTSGLVFADGNSRKREPDLSVLFIKELSKNGGREIRSRPDFCLSKARPLTVNQELAEMLVYALQSSEYMTAKSECAKIVGDPRYQSCRFYLHSTSKKYQWSAGFSFLGNPANGEIDFDSLECFST